MKIFLTGASGFVGRHLAEMLINRGHTVTAAVRSGSDTSRIPAGCRIVSMDLSSPESIFPHLTGTEVIFHVAGAVKARSGEEFDTVNAGLTAALVHAAKSACPDALFILTSSQAAAGPGGNGPRSSYGRSKLLAEQVVTGFPRYIIVRSPAALGPDDKETKSFYTWAKRGITVTLGNSDIRFCIISISDLTNFMAGLVNMPGAEGLILQPSHPELVTWKQMHKALEKAANRKILRIPVPSCVVYTAGFLGEVAASFTGFLPLLDREKALDITSSGWQCRQDKVEQITGWKPELSLEETIAEALK
ncbi:MAG: NAD-dependent epimerase/dehydratase family protein [Candidatus Fermentibacteraceae bacterium]|nr:NAD-dependent epimerase/dehydratase family protein [Candidatus Fermentibacteraceae bacterium]